MKEKETSKSYLIEVQPLIRGLREPAMTYFSSESYALGSAIMVPFRSKEIMAIVLSVKPVLDAKTQIKSIGFSLRKIPQQKERLIFSSSLLGMIKSLSDYYATSPGDILSSITPTAILESDLEGLKEGESDATKRKRTKRVFVQGDTSDRFERYKELISKSLKKGESVMLLAPTLEDVRFSAENLKKHFGDDVYELTSTLKKHKQIELWEKATRSEVPVVVILTSGFLSIPLFNVGLCIIEKVGSSQFIGLRRPYLDGKVVMERIAKQHKARLVQGDVLIPLTEIKSAQGENMSDLKEISLRGKTELVRMTDSKDVESSERVTETAKLKRKKPFKLISDDLLALTEQSIEEGKKVFWFVARRGLFPSTVCRDCGALHACDKCEATLVLHEKNNKRIFLCHRCGHKEETLVTCKHCNSWRLEPLGVGVIRVFEEAQSKFENTHIVSADVTATKTKIRKSIKDFYSSQDGALLVGTDLALPYLESGVDVVGVVSLDSRLSLPLFNAEESALRTLLAVSSLASDKVIVQTRRPDSRVFVSISGKSLDEFRKEEANLRRSFLYPPYSTLISITLSKGKEEVESLRERISGDLEDLVYEGDQVLRPALRGAKKKGLYSATIILKLTRNLEENEGLREFIRSLPPSVIVRVGPENLW